MYNSDFLKDFLDGLFDLNKEFKNNIKEFNKADLFNPEKDEHNATYTYNKPMTPEEKKAAVVKHMNHWCFIANLSGNKDAKFVVNFVFGKDEFYFEWVPEMREFVTTDPNGDKFYYDPTDETLVKIDDKDQQSDNNKDINKNKDCASSVKFDVKDNTLSEKDVNVKRNDEDDNLLYHFNIDDDKHLAFNLKNALTKWHEENEKDDNDPVEDECGVLFCPLACVDDFKSTIIDRENYETTYNDNGEPVQIEFDIDDFLPEFENDSDYFVALDEIYHEESQNLDKFCELLKEKYGFSMGSWTVEFEDESKDHVVNISFVFTF